MNHQNRLLALLSVVLWLATSFTSGLAAANRPTMGSTDEVLTIPLPGSSPKLNDSFGRQALAFEPNVGQMDGEVDFLARGPGYQLFLTETEAVMVLNPPAPDRGAKRLGLRQSSAAFSSPVTVPKAPEDWRTPRPGGDATAPLEVSASQPLSHVLRMRLVGANASPSVRGDSELRGKANYFIGNDPALWHANVPTFGQVRSADVYPGIDLVYYGNEGQLEYDFVVAPGADPNLIALNFEGADRIELDAHGDLVAWVAGRPVRWQKPFVYQECDGRRIEVAGAYRLDHDSLRYQADAQIGFELAAYDRSLALVIDPALVYSTYLPLGNDIWSAVSAIAAGGEGSVFVTGVTAAPDFPVKNPLQASLGGKLDAFVTKFDSSGQIVFSTYIGGNEQDALDYGTAIKVDSAGNAYVAGETGSTNFPTANALQPHRAGVTPGGWGNEDAFVLKLTQDGSALVYSTYLGGSGYDSASALALGNDGSAYVGGSTISRNFPVTNAFQATFRGEIDGFLAKLSPSGSVLVYSTYLGGLSNDLVRGVAVDPSGQAFIVGRTGSVNFPMKDAFQLKIAFPDVFPPGTTGDIFITQLAADGKAVVFSTYFGGSGNDDVQAGVALGPNGDLYFAGKTKGGFGLGTWYDDFPTVAALEPNRLAGSCGYVTRFSPITKAPVFSTYFGRTVDYSGTFADGDAVSGIAVDADGKVYLAGYTGYGEFSLVNSLPGSELIGSDDYASYAAVMAADGSELLFSTLLSSGFSEPDVALGDQGSFYIAGVTSSGSLGSPVLQNPILPAPADAHSAFIAKLTLKDALSAIRMIRSGDTLVVSWPASVIDSQLETSATLGAGSVWNNVVPPPVVIGDEQIVTVDIGPEPEFFRLRKP